MIAVSDDGIIHYGRDRRMEAQAARCLKSMSTSTYGATVTAVSVVMLHVFVLCEKGRWLLKGAGTWSTRTQYVAI